MILKYGNLSPDELDELHYYAVSLEWNESGKQKEIGRLIKMLLKDYETACDLISDNASIDAEMETYL